MKTLLARYGVPALLLYSGALAVLAFIISLTDLGKPFPGFLLMRDITGAEWYIAGETPFWWPGLRSGVLTYSDRVLAIDGHPLNPGVDYMALYQRAYDRGAREITLKLRRGDHVFDARAPLVLFTPVMLFEMRWLSLIFWLCTWLLALAVYSAAPGETLNRVVSALGALMVIVLGAFFSSLNFDTTDWMSRIVEIGWLIGVSFLGVVIWAAVMLFTTPASRLRTGRAFRVGFVALFVAGILNALLYLSLKALWWSFGWSPTAGTLQQIAFVLANLTLFGTGLVAVGRIVWAAHAAPSPRLRGQSRVLMIGFWFTLPLIFAQLLANFSQHPVFFVGAFDLRYLYLSVPVALAIAVLRYQMLRGAHPSFVAALALGGAALAAGMTDWLLRTTGNIVSDATPIVPATLVLSAAILLTSVAAVLLPRWAGRLFNWEGQRYTAVRHFLNRVAPHADAAGLPDEIAHALVTELKVERAGLWLRNGGDTLRQAALVSRTPQTVTDALPAPSVLQLPSGALSLLPSVSVLTPSDRWPDWLSGLQQAGFVMVAPLAAQGETLGLLALGLRWDEETFHRRDVEIVELIALQASLFLLNARQIEMLRQVPRRVSEAQEQERFTIAQELHDTVQQFLGRLPFHLELSRRAIRVDPAAADARLERCITDVEHAARTLRQIRGNLAPTQLAKTLAQPLFDLVERFRVRSGLNVSVEIDPTVDHVLDVETRHALFRVVQQALDNVEAHANATSVRVTVLREGGGVVLTVADNGRGFTPEQQSRAIEEGHFGILSMHARAESLGGTLTLDSAPGQGVCVRAWLPARVPIAQTA
ncbi:MAG: ATP-binding protein [Anaerolineae bacterium]|nr:histidine kinase [Thermoflexales bacterium]MDW8407364.1 ATP-binding protein [Anaerolineae bacterium]